MKLSTLMYKLVHTSKIKDTYHLYTLAAPASEYSRARAVYKHSLMEITSKEATKPMVTNGRVEIIPWKFKVFTVAIITRSHQR